MANISMDYQSLDLGSTIATPVEAETIHVCINPDVMLLDYGRAFAKECYRVNDTLATRVGISEEELADYCLFLLDRRVATIKNDCPDWRKLKLLWIPSFVQHAMSMIGEVKLRDKGLIITPELEAENVIDFEKALEISEKISYFQDQLQMVQDAMPRGVTGDESVMSTALIAGYVRALRKVDHIADTYVTTFLGFKIKEEVSMAVLYRTQYDDVNYIVSALSHARLF